MALYIEATETSWFGRHFQLVFTAESLTGLMLSGCRPEAWREVWTANGQTGIDPAVPVARLANHYRRLGTAAVVGECHSNFVLPWSDVHEIRLHGNGSRLSVRLAARKWFCFRPWISYRIVPSAAYIPDHFSAELEQELCGHVRVLRH